MKRINNRPVAVEAVLTRHGTIVGPFMSELTGYTEAHPVPRRLVRQRDVPRGADRRTAGARQRNWSAGSATGWPRRATGASSRSTCWSTPTPTRSTSASSTRGSAAPRRSPTSPPAPTPTCRCSCSTCSSTWTSTSTSTSTRSTSAGRSWRPSDVWSQMIIKETDDDRRAAHRDAPHRAVLARRQRRAGVPPGRAGLAPAAERGARLLPADLRPRRLPLEGRRPRRAGDQGPAAGRLGRRANRR